MASVAGEVGVDPDAFVELEASFRGPLIRPGDPTYDEHRRVWNASIDRHPALIAKCAGVARRDRRGAVREGDRTPSGGQGAAATASRGYGTCDGGAP